jgi:hypothetical protein
VRCHEPFIREEVLSKEKLLGERKSLTEKMAHAETSQNHWIEPMKTRVKTAKDEALMLGGAMRRVANSPQK